MPEAPFEKPHEHPRKVGGATSQSKIQNPKSKIGAFDSADAQNRGTPPRRYAELHCLSNFSFLRGASHPEELVEQAARLGYRSIAITDRNSLAGVVRAHIAAKQHNMHLIIGSEITPLDGPPIVLLAPDRAAYGRLSRLITVGRRRAKKGDCILYVADVAEYAEGLIAIVGERHEGTEARRHEGGKK
ncbi:MAG: PHP domain-containing protein, partial [Phycisphaerae bacterium]